MKKLVAYLTSAYPTTSFSIDLIHSLGENGVDLFELGIPFSDPVADGPIIEKANYEALHQGYNFEKTLEVSEAVAKTHPILWMGYFNSFYQKGIETIVTQANQLGVKGFIIPDMPHEEFETYKKTFLEHNIANIAFVAPTDSENRIKTLVANSQLFIYLVAYAGITGADKSEDLSGIIRSIKHYASTPVYVGFGVNQKTAKERSQHSDGVIVGSEFIKVLLDHSLSEKEKIAKCAEIARIIKEEIN